MRVSGPELGGERGACASMMGSRARLSTTWRCSASSRVHGPGNVCLWGKIWGTERGGGVRNNAPALWIAKAETWLACAAIVQGTLTICLLFTPHEATPTCEVHVLVPFQEDVQVCIELRPLTAVELLEQGVHGGRFRDRHVDREGSFWSTPYLLRWHEASANAHDWPGREHHAPGRGRVSANAQTGNLAQ